MAKYFEENSTEHTEVNHILTWLCPKIHSVLKNNLVGIYLYGSLVSGDFDYDTSDIDLLVVTEADINKREFSILNKMHMDLVKKFKNWDDRIEIAYIAKKALKTFKQINSSIAVISPGEPFNIKNAGIDWLMNWYIVRKTSVTILGPNPNTVIEDISKDEFIFAVKNHAIDWYNWVTHTKESRSFQAYAVLTICRAFYVINNGEQVSKKQAANWAQKMYPEWATLIENALAWRTDWQNKAIDPQDTYPEVEKFVHQLISTIK